MKDLTFKQKVIQGIHDLFYIWKREFRTTFRDQGVLIFFVLVPLVYPLIYAFIYTNETSPRSAHCRGGRLAQFLLAGNICGKWMPVPK